MGKNEEEELKNAVDRQVKEVLSFTEPLTVQELEDEMMHMLAHLQPFPIVMRRARGLIIEDETPGRAFMEEDGFDDTVYYWYVGESVMETWPKSTNIDQWFTVAVYHALTDRTQKLLSRKK